MPDDEGGAAPNPGTLEAPPTVDKDYVRQKQLALNAVLREHQDRNPDAEYVRQGDTYIKKYNRTAGSNKLDEFGFSGGDDESGIITELAEPEVRAALRELLWAQDELEYLDSVRGSAKSWYDTEQNKTQEIERQYDDFKDRATTYSRLLGDEQEYAMNVDEANADAYKYMRQSGAATRPSYGDIPMSESLSRILRPSLPDYVRPDYRLNAAVGLPGPEGFDDPDYGMNGMPRFAAGTGAEGDGHADLLATIQSQLGYIPWMLQPKERPPWPWRREA